jgi:hypothetical protein
MSFSSIELSMPLARAVRFDRDSLIVDLADGRSLVVPIGWFPRLALGSAPERQRWRLIGEGHGIHWPDLDEDIAVIDLLAGRRSGENAASLRRWREGRTRNL